MGNWAELPEDLLALTAKRLTLFEDFLAFSGVCRSWRSVATNDNFKGSEQTPWLMLSEKVDKPDEFQFVSLRKGGVVRTVNLPEARGKRCLETLGWLVTISEDGNMNLLHPFTRVQVVLPNVFTFKSGNLKTMGFYPLKHFIHKAVLSSRPEESKDYVLVVIYSLGYLAFWRPGDKAWTEVEVPIVTFSDLIFHEGICYGVMSWGMVYAVDVSGPDPTLPWLVLMQPERGICLDKQPFIVESAGVVLMVIRDAWLPDSCDEDHFVPDELDMFRVGYRTCRFQVFEAVLSRQGKWVEITSLGDVALFLGENASVSVDASRFPGIKANCIYYTGKSWQFYKHGIRDMGIYCLEDGSKSPWYEGESFNPICPPLWVNPSSSIQLC